MSSKFFFVRHTKYSFIVLKITNKITANSNKPVAIIGKYDGILKRKMS